MKGRTISVSDASAPNEHELLEKGNKASHLFKSPLGGLQHKNINKNEAKVFENLFKSLRDEKDRHNFAKLLKIYYEGILSLKDFIMLYN